MLSLGEAFPSLLLSILVVAGFGITESPNLSSPFRWLILHVLTEANAPFELNTNIYLYTENYTKIQVNYFTGITASWIVISGPML